MRPPLLFIGSSFVHKTSNILCTLRYIIVFYCHECLGCICVVFLCYVDLFSPCGKIFLFLAPLPSCKVIRFANNDIAEIFPKTFLNYFSTIFLPSCKRGHPICQQCADAQEAKVDNIIINTSLLGCVTIFIINKVK